MNNIKKIHQKLYDLSKIKYIFLMGIISCVILIPFKFYKTYGAVSKGESIYFNILVWTVLPLVKTFLYQKCVIKLLQCIKKIKDNKIVLICITAIIFSLLNVHNFEGFILLSIFGIILAYSYIMYKDKDKTGFSVTTIIHSIVYIFCSIMVNIN